MAMVVPDFPGTINQSICPGQAMEGIRFDVFGSIDATVIGISGLPPGISRTNSVTANNMVLTVSNTEVDDVYTVIVDGVSYSATATGSTVAPSVLVTQLIDDINNDAGSRVTALVSATNSITFTLTADTPGVPFTVYLSDENGPGADTQTTTLEIIQENVNFISLTGTPTSAAVLGKVYTYTMTSPGLTCAPFTTSGTLTISRAASIELTSDSATTLNQELCVSTVANVTSLTPITFKITGATGYDIPALVNATFTGLPRGIVANDNATNQQEVVTVSGVAPGHTYTLMIDGEAYSYTVTNTNDETDVLDSFTASITADPVISLRVNATVPAAGVVTITAAAQGTPFNIAVEKSGVTTGTITVSNTVGTYELTIQGNPNTVDPNNDGSYPLSITKYNYTISTTGGSCDNAEFTDTITIVPSENIQRNGTADDDGDGSPDFPGTINQSICPGQAMEGIRFDVFGSIDATVIGISGLPPGISRTNSVTAQQYGLTVSNTGVDDVYTVIVDGVSYSATATGSTVTPSLLVTQLMMI